MVFVGFQIVSKASQSPRGQRIESLTQIKKHFNFGDIPKKWPKYFNLKTVQKCIFSHDCVPSVRSLKKMLECEKNKLTHLYLKFFPRVN